METNIQKMSKGTSLIKMVRLRNSKLNLKVELQLCNKYNFNYVKNI